MARARKEKPLWQLGKDRNGGKPGSSPVVVHQGPDGKVTRLTGRKATEVTRQLGKPKSSPPPLAAYQVPFRFRFHLIPFGWLAAAGAAIIAHARGAQVAGALSLVTVAAAVVLLTRHLPRFQRTRCQLFASWLIATGLVWDIWGPVPLPSWLGVIAWAVLAASWTRHYHWRPVDPVTPTVRVDKVKATWKALAEQNHWVASLGPGKAIPSGMQYPVICVGTHTHIGDITSKPQKVAAAFDQPITQAYVEQHPSGIQSRGMFTMLDRATLEETRHWAGGTIDPRTGLAVVGRFPDGKDVHEKFFSLPKDGISHTLIAGDMGSGKSELINLSMTLSVTSGLIAPVILDPQMGQALPAWQDHVPYACGTDECRKWLKALHATMFDRSEYLAGLTFCDPQTNRWRKGMGFFNPFVIIRDPVTGEQRPLGLPIVEITVDESPILLAIKGMVPLILDIAKLGRKVGFRLRLVAQVPSLAELKAQELRSMLRGSNVFCLRSGDNVTGGYTGVTGDPNLLAKYWPNGSKTYGLGYADTIDNQSATPMRTDLVMDAYEVAETTRIRTFDDRAAARLAEVLAQEDATVAQLSRAADAMAGLKLAVISQLTEPRTRGELLAALLPDGHQLSEITEAVSQLEADRRIRESGGKYVVVL